MLVNDLLFASVAWWLAFVTRFYSGFFHEPSDYVFRHYVIAWVIIVCVWTVVFRSLDLYRPRRISTHRREFIELIKASSLALFVFLAVVFLLHEIVLSRIVVLLFWVSSLFFLSVSHIVFREGLRFLRRRGYNMRHVIVIGAPRQVKQLVTKLVWYRHVGIQVVGVYFTQDSPREEWLENAKIFKGVGELAARISSGGIDQIFVTLPLEQTSQLPEIQRWLGDEPVTFHFVPDLGELAKLRGQMEEFDGLSIITLQSSPFYGWNSLVKRSMDLALGGLAFLLASPLMALIAVGIKLSSSGPVLYRQERMGLDGERFEMLKFRTMMQGAEQLTGPIWATNDDPRVTTLGRWLRRTSLDELPQLMNVLRGEMSLVGPRPERPPLIEEFRKSIPKYMLRHKVKAGMTGWAQVNGWRGNTSLERRIEHDLDYIEHWSLWRDVKILLRTLFVGFRNNRASNM